MILKCICNEKKENKILVKTRENTQNYYCKNHRKKKLVKPKIIATLIYVFQNRNKIDIDEVSLK